MLQQSPALARLAAVADRLRERLDGGEYPRGLTVSSIPRPARLLKQGCGRTSSDLPEDGRHIEHICAKLGVSSRAKAI